MKIVTFNILSDRAFTYQPTNYRAKHDKNQFHSEFLWWDNRKNLLIAQIHEFMDDGVNLFCFQEAMVDSFEEDFGTFLRQFGFAYIQSSPKKNSSSNHSLVIAYRTTMYTLTRHEHRSRTSIAFFTEIVYDFCSGKPSPGTDICIINVHLDALDDVAASKQLSNSLDRVESFRYKIIVCGDFNRDIESDVLQSLFQKGFKPVRHEKRKKYKTYKNVCIDHIFYKNFHRTHAKNETETYHDTFKIPSELVASDHIPVCARFVPTVSSGDPKTESCSKENRAQTK